MASPPSSVAPAVDLTSCDQEPIHIPGAIQPHGVLIALDEPNLRIVRVSANTVDHGMPTPASLLGQGLDTVLAPRQRDGRARGTSHV